MKNFVEYVGIEQVEPIRILELLVPSVLPSREANSLAGIAQEVACIECVVKMSRIHEGLRFVWGHEESDGRVWIHGLAIGGQYRSIGGSQVRKRPVKEIVTDFPDGTARRAVSDGDAFEIDLDRPPFADWKSMTFKLDGVEVASIYRGGK